MKSKVTILLSLFILTLFGQTVLSQEREVKLQFSVLDENENAVPDLKLSDIQISQDKQLLRVNSIVSKAESPLEVVIMVDASASQEKMLPFEKRFAESIINEILIEGKDKVAVVKFSGEVELVQDLTENFSQAKKQLNSIKFEPPAGYIGGGIVASQTSPTPKQIMKGSTSIWDSIVDITEAFTKLKNSNYRQILILISDGVNTYGEAKLKEAVVSSVKNKIPIYAVGIGDDFYDGVDKKTLKKLTEQTGGVLILPDGKGKNIDKQLMNLKTGLHSCYEIIFMMNQTGLKDSLQEIKVEINNSELSKKKPQIIQPKWFVVFGN